MTTTDPTTRPIHERWSFGDRGADGTLTTMFLDGEYFALLLDEELPAADSLIAAAGKTHAVLVNLPDCAGGGQLVTWSYPSGAVEAAWRENPAATWTPVGLQSLGGSVEVAP